MPSSTTVLNQRILCCGAVLVEPSDHSSDDGPLPGDRGTGMSLKVIEFEKKGRKEEVSPRVSNDS